MSGEYGCRRDADRTMRIHRPDCRVAVAGLRGAAGEVTMTLWTSVAIVLAFSFLVVGLDEYWHWRRKQRKQQAQGEPKKPS